MKLASFSAFLVHVALNEPLKFRCDDLRANRAWLTELLPTSLTELRKSFDQLKYGEFPDTPLFGAGSHSVVDPSRTPAGKATMYFFSYAPYHLANGGAAQWDSIRESY